MMTFEEIIDQLDVWEEWRDRYNSFVPQFIEEAKTGKNWDKWREDIFYEFFERSGHQCVASIQQGYFTNKDKEYIRNNWSELAPMLQSLALTQEKPLFDTYKQIKDFLRKHTSLNRKAATNRLVASLQPKLLCSVVNEHNLWQLFNYLKINVNDVNDLPEFIGGDWFRNSFNLWQFYQNKISGKDYTEIVTLPWETFEYFRGGNHLPQNKNKDMSEENPLIGEYIDLLQYKRQIILQGAPGTGKTYTAKDIAEKYIFNSVLADKKEQAERLKNSSQFNLVQFHPSYSYEDFVRGIVVNTDNGSPEYINQNKILGKFAKEAWENWNLYQLGQGNEINKVLSEKYSAFQPSTISKEIQSADLKNYVLIIDEINRANLPAVLGELIYALEYRGEKVESTYAVDGDNGFILPPNLYIIGTMNTADRSVGQIDYAIRRRFAFVDMLPTILLEEETFDQDLFTAVSGLFIKNIEEYIADNTAPLACSEHLSSEFRPEDVWIGHSYFIMKDCGKEKRLKYEIVPILKEYLKDGILKESARKVIEDLR